MSLILHAYKVQLILLRLHLFPLCFAVQSVLEVSLYADERWAHSRGRTAIAHRLERIQDDSLERGIEELLESRQPQALIVDEGAGV